jgi:hypothetical protein
VRGWADDNVGWKMYGALAKYISYLFNSMVSNIGASSYAEETVRYQRRSPNLRAAHLVIGCVATACCLDPRERAVGTAGKIIDNDPLTTYVSAPSLATRGERFDSIASRKATERRRGVFGVSARARERWKDRWSSNSFSFHCSTMEG